ncbi:MAG: spermidine/putrescine ABC transporter substrate-binding protein [Verrucomicrobiae bacterium]|nr:spermidine/putrescine ABC transporter substrate-binding protein [Verrucomicrobiae bacterium]
MKTIAKHLRITAFLLFSISLGGCQKGEEVLTSDSSESPSEEVQEVVVYSWEEYFNPEVIAKFETETGIRVRFEYYDSLGALAGGLQSQPDAFDVVVVDDVTLLELKDIRMVRPLDHKLLANLGNFYARYVDQEFDPGNEYSIPYLWGTTLIAYRRDRLPDPEKSWKLLFNPDLKGRVALMEEKEDLYAAALMSLGLRMDSEEIEDLERATEFLSERVAMVRPKFSALEGIKDLIATGKCDVACLYSGDAAILAEEDEGISYFIPEEGAPIWMDNLAIARESKNVENAHLFLDFISRGDIAAENANFLWYATPNKTAEPFLSDDLLADEAIYPPAEVMSRCAFHANPSLERLEAINRGMKRIFDQARSEIVQSAPITEEESNSDSE